MITASKQTEITIHVTPEPGVLSQPLAVIAASGSAVIAMCSYWNRTEAVFLLVTENTPAAIRALEAAGFSCATNPVLLVGPLESPGHIAVCGAELAAARIAILYSYSYVAESTQHFVVFKTDNNDRAVHVLATCQTVGRRALAESAPRKPVVSVARYEPPLARSAA